MGFLIDSFVRSANSISRQDVMDHLRSLSSVGLQDDFEPAVKFQEGTDRIDPEPINRDKEELENKVKRVKIFADKWVAHLDKDREDYPPPDISEFDGPINYLEPSTRIPAPSSSIASDRRVRFSSSSAGVKSTSLVGSGRTTPAASAAEAPTTTKLTACRWKTSMIAPTSRLGRGNVGEPLTRSLPIFVGTSRDYESGAHRLAAFHRRSLRHRGWKAPDHGHRRRQGRLVPPNLLR